MLFFVFQINEVCTECNWLNDMRKLLYFINNDATKLFTNPKITCTTHLMKTVTNPTMTHPMETVTNPTMTRPMETMTNPTMTHPMETVTNFTMIHPMETVTNPTMTSSTVIIIVVVFPVTLCTTAGIIFSCMLLYQKRKRKRL